MTIGLVKWFNVTRGYGFIIPTDGGKDVFFHVLTLQAAGLKSIIEGQAVSYDVVTERGKIAAVNLKLM